MQPRFPVRYMNIPNLYQQEPTEIKAFENSVLLFDLEGGPEVEI